MVPNNSKIFNNKLQEFDKKITKEDDNWKDSLFNADTNKHINREDIINLI